MSIKEQLQPGQPNRVLALRRLGKLTDEFRELAISGLEALPPGQSIHSIIEHLVQTGIDQRIGVDNIARFIADKNVRKVLAARVHEIFCEFFPPPSEPPMSISKDAMAWGIQLVIRYFLDHFRSGSFHEYLQQAAPESPEPFHDELCALFSCESFQDTVVRGFANFAKVIVHDSFTTKMKDEAVRSAYFGDFVATLCTEDRTEGGREMQDERWGNLFHDALDHGVPEEFIFDLIRKQNAVPELREAFGLSARAGKSMQHDTSLSRFTALWQKALHRSNAAKREASGFLTETLKGGDTSDFSEAVDPFVLLSMVSDPAHHRGEIEAYCAKYFFRLDEETLNKHFYREHEPPHENSYKVFYP